jgi:hypothetical protein
LDTDEKVKAAKVVWQTMSDREKIYNLTSIARSALHEWLVDFKVDAGTADVRRFESLTGLYLYEDHERSQILTGLESDYGKYKFEVHTFRGAQRIAPDGSPVNRVIVSITQKRSVPLEEGTTDPDAEPFTFRGGCTMIFDLNTLKLKYLVKKLIDDSDDRLKRQRAYRTGEGGASLRMTYFGPPEETEPFALLHSDV